MCSGKLANSTTEIRYCTDCSLLITRAVCISMLRNVTFYAQLHFHHNINIIVEAAH